MEPPALQSPLTQQSRPEYFEPKVVHLYRRLFKGGDEDDDEKTEGFWKELFLLKPELARLQEILEESDPDVLLHQQHDVHEFVRQSIVYISRGEAPTDENALDTWTVFFPVVLAKKYANPSSDVIEVLAGLDNVDSVFGDLVATLDHVIREGRTIAIQQKAVKTAIALISGGYNTALVSYFINRDFFPASLKLVQELNSPLQASEPLLLIGLLADYNKFEVHNQYQVRFADFVNDEIMKLVVDSISWICTLLRERYVAIQDDTPVTWSISSTLSYVGLGSLTTTKPVNPPLTEDEQKELFNEQPGLEVASLLTIYDFVISNKLFCQHFIANATLSKDQPLAFSNFLSFTSYLYQHAYRNSRASAYSYLTLVILLTLVEDASTAKLLCEQITPVRLCRQRAPLLPYVKHDRSYAANLLDILTDAINHNLRKRLDTAFYSKTLTVLTRLLSHLSRTRLKLEHHWSEFWRSLLAFLRFLTSYSDDLRSLPGGGISKVVDGLVNILFLAMTNGEAFLPDSAAYDDLLYKLVESGEVLAKLRDTYGLGSKSEEKPGSGGSPINGLIGVSAHYQELIESQRAKKDVLNSREVGNIIKQGYETLTFEGQEAAEQSLRFREAEHKTELKRITRVVVADAVAMVAR